MNINIAGDFFIDIKINNPLNLVENIIPFFEASDFNIVNLESPVTDSDKQNKILKTGPHLNGHPETINILKVLKVNLVTLANNHIMDFGRTGLENTIRSLKTNEINHIGAGLNLNESAKVFTLEKEGLKIAFLNFTENEWSIAENDEPGANPLDVIENVTQIKLAKENHNKVIVIIHGGHEHYHLPSPRMVKQYRFYAENGADVIIGHHTHCISGYEVFNKVPIFYSLGNFLFTMDSSYKSWYTGLLLKLHITKDKEIGFELYPTKQKKQVYVVELMQGSENLKTKEEINQFSKIIIDSELLKQNWDCFLNEKEKQYIQSLSVINIINNRYIRAGLNRLNFHKLLIKKQNLILILNLMRCEAHADATKQIINKYLKKLQ